MRISVLIIILGSYSHHIQNFIANVKHSNPDIIFDIISRQQDNVPVEILNNTRNQYSIKRCKCKVSIVRSIMDRIYLFLTFRKIAKDQKYNVINIHYPEAQLFHVIRFLKTISQNIVISPWGSDVYRAPKKDYWKLKCLYNSAAFITIINNRFGHDVCEIFNIPSSKVTSLSMASSTIDFFITNKITLSVEKAKEMVGVRDKFVITIGYNSQKAQNHIHIIRAISSIKDHLPKNLILLFPLTYGIDNGYVDEIKAEVKKTNMDAVYFQHFLSLKELLELRKSTDVFIHMQQTDANNSSIKEYLYLDKIVINASWLSYEQIERFSPKNYLIADNFNVLPNVIINACDIQESITPLLLKKEIEETGYLYWAPRWASFYKSL